jgi:hypothetical protein
MLNAYRGVETDRRPVAPEFWYYYPAKVLGVSMVEFERDIPLWQALQTTFRRFGTEGWGIVAPEVTGPWTTGRALVKISADRYRETTVLHYGGKEFTSSRLYSVSDPSWPEKMMAGNDLELADCLDVLLSGEREFDFTKAGQAYAGVGEDYLLELYLGEPFFDTVAGLMGFEQAALYFQDEHDDVLQNYLDRLVQSQRELVRRAAAATPFESYFIGCSYSCTSLLGTKLWQKWDKPYIRAMADELHARGKLLHIHFHGRSMRAAPDFADIGIDCVCPFERPPGGDVAGSEGLQDLRALLDEKVTMNGNVHTVETLIRGGPADVRREVQQIKEAFQGSRRLVIGTGDQVGRETPEANIWAMVDEGRK